MTGAQKRAAHFARIDAKFGQFNTYNQYGGDLEAYLSDLDAEIEAVESAWADEIGWERSAEYLAEVNDFNGFIIEPYDEDDEYEEDDYSEESAP